MSGEWRRVGVRQAHQVLTEHRFYKYRGCAPDPDDPRVAAGDPRLSVDAWLPPTSDGGESQQERHAREEAAIAVCRACPVVEACDAYASSLSASGRLAEPYGVLGGRRALERHRVLVALRHAERARDAAAVGAGVVAGGVRVDRLRTAQKLAVLGALAACWEPFEVARRAGVDVRTANWQRSNVVTLLGLPRDVSRMRLLAVVRELGLLAGVRVVDDGGGVPAVAAPTKTTVRVPGVPAAGTGPVAGPARAGSGAGAGRGRLEDVGGRPGERGPVAAEAVPLFATPEPSAAGGRRRRSSGPPGRRARVVRAVQPSLDDALAHTLPAAVSALPFVDHRLEAAA
ncbi:MULTISPECIES: WhiB family transcriptional regulator [unclassified Streptomyces]|uniref:WhiB family transcriptional regulator n=1 Tax=unclassified Streptomyces TaxID=2593676 RepID=UPI001F165F92|nr:MULTISPECIES: WhiB family transcriptional regulator [unclassified Streptomyces]MCF0086626.1 Transcriptional regulator WhiB [Streptomyces sp. MH192]MCF0098780.1 Transcriptional regulator WhiB [Streptomyces sp. MH191]